MRKKTSIIWKVDKSELEDVISKSDTIKEVLAYFGLVSKGGNYKTLRSRIEHENIDISEFKKRSEKARCSMSAISRKRPLFEVMVEGSTYSRGNLKKRLLKEKMLDNKCSICGLDTEWNGKPIVMILDHINGIPDDHRLENLRLLCPNCNSQTSTFAGRSLRIKRYCSECGKEKKIKDSKLCRPCQDKSKRKVKWPEKEELKKMIKTMSWCAIGRKYGVSDNAVRKWARSYGLL
jgi:Zn finger protein HypA/HybF involved in hydrogenase expression